jgi:hypothetical protein
MPAAFSHGPIANAARRAFPGPFWRRQGFYWPGYGYAPYEAPSDYPDAAPDEERSLVYPRPEDLYPRTEQGPAPERVILRAFHDQSRCWTDTQKVPSAHGHGTRAINITRCY